MKEIQPEPVALEKEMKRLTIIDQITHEVGRNLEYLAITLV